VWLTPVRLQGQIRGDFGEKATKATTDSLELFWKMSCGTRLFFIPELRAHLLPLTFDAVATAVTEEAERKAGQQEVLCSLGQRRRKTEN